MSCNAGVCTATAKKAVLNVGDLQAMLASSDITVKTGSVTENIDIDRPLSWASTSRLTLDAHQFVIVKRPVTVTGAGSLTLIDNDGGTAGDLLFLGKAAIEFLNPDSTLTINGNSYTLVYDVATLANAIAHDISGKFALASNYDAGNGRYSGSPVPEFGGTFEGLGHRLSHIHVHDRPNDSYVGFFGKLNSSAVVRDIGFENGTLASKQAYFVGGLAGLNLGLIVGAHVSGKVRGSSAYTGGLAGYNDQYATISRSSADVDVHGSTTGGLVGNSYGMIDQCFASGTSSVGGGLVGLQSWGQITNSYASGRVSAGIGGLVALGLITVTSSYSTAEVGPTNFSGGLIGEVHANAVQTSYWDIDTAGVAYGCGEGDCSGVAGLSDAQLKSALPAGFDPRIWGQSPSINNGYPYLLANPPQ
jgi:The GLUG motif